MRKFIIVVIMFFLPTLVYPQPGTENLTIHYWGIGGATANDTVRILDFIRDSLLFGGVKLSDPAFAGIPRGIGLFSNG